MTGTRIEPPCTDADGTNHKWQKFHYWSNAKICTQCLCLVFDQIRGYDRWADYVVNTPEGVKL